MPSCGHLSGPDLLLVYNVVFQNSTMWFCIHPYFLSSMIVFPVCSEAFYLEAILNGGFISTQNKRLSSSTL